MIATDLFPALAPMIRSGKVFATLYQRPKSQGRMAFQLYQFLVQGSCPPFRRRIPPHLLRAAIWTYFWRCCRPIEKIAWAKWRSVFMPDRKAIDRGA